MSTTTDSTYELRKKIMDISARIQRAAQEWADDMEQAKEVESAGEYQMADSYRRDADAEMRTIYECEDGLIRLVIPEWGE